MQRFYKLRRRLNELRLMLNFAAARGETLRDKWRLFYYSGVKESLTHRGWRSYSESKILSFSLRAYANRFFQVCARDNGMDVSTVAEFFSTRWVILPPELPPLQPKVIYDLGANIGAASLYFATHYPDSRFYGFEPLPSNYKFCTLNYKNLRGAQVFPWAISAASGIATFELNINDPRGGRLKGCPPPLQTVLNEKIVVSVFSIADLIHRQKLEPPDFLKIDVEGAEVEVLKGIGESCPNLKRILIETHGLEVETACLEWIKNNGFRVGHLHSVAPGFSSVWCDRV
jgi:FkbM family methyltransferase